MTLEERIKDILDLGKDCWEYEYQQSISESTKELAEFVRIEVGNAVNYGFDLACDKDGTWSSYADEHKDLNGGQIFDILKEQYLNKLK